MGTERNKTHTFIASGKTDVTAVIAAMLLSLGTTSQGRDPGNANDCLRFDDKGDNNVTIAWRRRRGDWKVSFRHADRDPETEPYRSAWDAAEAVHLGYHPEGR